MNREELEATLEDLKEKALARQNALLSNDGIYRDLNAQITVYEKWLGSLTDEVTP